MLFYRVETGPCFRTRIITCYSYCPGRTLPNLCFTKQSLYGTVVLVTVWLPPGEWHDAFSGEVLRGGPSGRPQKHPRSGGANPVFEPCF